jgi:Na+/proline symporter
MTTGALAVFGYLAALLVVAWFSRRQAASSDMFNIFGRSADLLRATSGYLSLIGAGELLTISQLGYDAGLSLLWFPGGIAAGFAFLGFFAEPIRLDAKAVGANTLVGYVARRFGSPAAGALLIVYVVSLGALLTIQFIIGSQLLSATTGLAGHVTSLVMACVIIFYLFLGGYVAVLSTDILRLFFLVVILGMFLLVVGPSFPTLIATTKFDFLSIGDGLTYFVLGFFGAVCAGDVWQTVLASKSGRVLRQSMLSAAAAFLGFGFIIGMLGMAAKSAVPTLPTDGSALLAATQSVIPAYMSAGATLLIVGSIMATADTEIWVVSSSVVSFFLPAPHNEPFPGAISFQDRAKTAVRFVIPIVTLLALALALFGKDARAIYEALLILLASIAPPILALMFKSVGPTSLAASLWIAIGSFAVLSAIYQFSIPPSLTFAPASAAFISLIATRWVKA